MITEETNNGGQNIAVSKDIKESPLPAAGYNTQKGGDPYGSIYQCPVKCEGSKTYEQPLNCPVCNEKMILVIS